MAIVSPKAAKGIPRRHKEEEQHRHAGQKCIISIAFVEMEAAHHIILFSKPPSAQSFESLFPGFLRVSVQTQPFPEYAVLDLLFHAIFRK
jgi:hypothetical protein